MKEFYHCSIGSSVDCWWWAGLQSDVMQAADGDGLGYSLTLCRLLVVGLTTVWHYIGCWWWAGLQSDIM